VHRISEVFLDEIDCPSSVRGSVLLADVLKGERLEF
jgi:hypothetical protein